jgi:hypothetical protein
MLSVQPGLRGSNDLRVGRKMATFQTFFFSRVGLRTYQHPYRVNKNSNSSNGNNNNNNNNNNNSTIYWIDYDVCYGKNDTLKQGPIQYNIHVEKFLPLTFWIY